MPPVSGCLTRVAWCISAVLVLSSVSSWAQDPPTLPLRHAASPEVCVQLEVAPAGSTIQPWQREFMRELLGAADESGAWNQLATAPRARGGHTAIYDPVRDRMVVFAGFDGSDFNFTNDVWVLSLGDTPAWSMLSPTGTLPPENYGQTAIYDPVRDCMVVFGGLDDTATNYFNGVWALSLSGTPAWSTLNPTGTLPPGRYAHTAIYDPVRDRMLVFGGFDGVGSVNDVWALSLSGTPAWSALSPTGILPMERHEHTAIYDPVRDRMVMFGGGDDRNDLWALSLSGTPAWSALSPPGILPAGRHAHTAIYDPVRDRMVVFGGSSGSARDDVWALSLSGTPAWSVLSPTGTLPPGRFEHTAIYDPTPGRMVVYGGSGDSDTFSDARALDWPALVAVDEPIPLGSLDFEFAPPRPNPARGSVSFDFSVPRTSRVSLMVHDSAGRMVRGIADATFVAGRYGLVWDRRNDDGQAVPSGIYFVRLHAPGVVLTERVILIQ